MNTMIYFFIQIQSWKISYILQRPISGFVLVFYEEFWAWERQHWDDSEITYLNQKSQIQPRPATHLHFNSG